MVDEGPFDPGTRVIVHWSDDGRMYSGIVERQLDDDNYLVGFEDGRSYRVYKGYILRDEQKKTTPRSRQETTEDSICSVCKKGDNEEQLFLCYGCNSITGKKKKKEKEKTQVFYSLFVSAPK